MNMRLSSMLRPAQKLHQAFSKIFLVSGLLLGLLLGSTPVVRNTPVQAATAPSSVLKTQEIFAPGSIQGNVFRDINGDGSRSDGNIEPGISGVRVFVYAADNSQIRGSGPSGSWLTDQDGNYAVTGLLAGQAFRLEFTLPSSLSFLQPGPVGPSSGTTVLFAKTGDEEVNVSFHDPNQYCEANPQTVTSCFVLGAYNSSNSTEPAVVSVPYAANGNDLDEATKLSDHGNVGTVYGLAYQRTTQSIYASAYHKRFTGFGPDGPDAIYQLDRNGNVTGSFSLASIPGGASAGVDVHDFSVVPNSGGDILDMASYAQVGTTSFGDLEISDDMSTLFVVNLANRKIYGVDVTGGNMNTAAVIYNWDAPDACVGAEHRPFGLGWNDGRLYVGSVCENASSAYVHSIAPSVGTFQLEVTIPLDYSRELIADASVEPGLGAPAPQPDNPTADWQPWSDDPTQYFITYVGALTSVPSSQYLHEIALPQPMLSDIEFDNEHMILGFRDRFGDQTGYQALQEPGSLELFSGVTAGDILRVCHVNNGWVVETGDGGACSATQGRVGASPDSGPGGEEYYYWDFFGANGPGQDFSPDAPTNYHFETVSGGLLQLDGKKTILTTALDPFTFSSAGYLRLDNQTGQRQGVDAIDIATPEEQEIGGYTIFNSDNIPTTFGKANGLGDIEALCSPPPIEIGNRVWNDSNGNGIQDANESAIAGVIVGLYNASGTLVASSSTSSSGHYYFSSGIGESTASAIYNIAGLLPGSTYTVGLLDTNFETTNVLEGYILTVANATLSGAAGDANGRDSDGQALGASIGSSANQSSTGVTLSTGLAGNNNHTFDFGLVQMDFGDLPESGGANFPTTGANGASHQIVSNVHLGGGVDRDSDGQPNTVANGDDSDGNDDEDGVTFRTPLMPGQSAIIAVNANVVGYLNAWIDYNTSGTFEANEHIASDRALVQGLNELTISVPTDATGVMYSRFRFTSDNPTGDLGPNNRWGNGEVEDYVLAEIGDRVWFDNGAGGGTAGDGLQNGSEPGAADVPVELLDGNGQPVLNGVGNPISTTTDSAGSYYFPGLAPGSYQVRFVPPANYSFTIQNSGANGSEAIDSDASPTTGVSDVVSLTPAEVNHDVDAGLVPLLSLGDLVWNDVNNNGLVDDNEVGIPNVMVTLWTVDATGSAQDAIDNQTTDDSGLYLFTGLNEGEYIVQLGSSNFVAGGPLTGYVNSTGNGQPAPDPDNNVNNDDNGDPAGGLGVLSQPITLISLDEPTNDGDDSNTSNLTVDFGFYLSDAAIDIEKDTNGEDADTGPGPLVGVGGEVVWTYVVRNTGAVALANLQLTDNIAGVEPVYVSGDANGDKLLQVSEVWTYRAAGVATEGQYANIGRVEGDPVDTAGDPIIGTDGQPLPPVNDEDPSHYFGLLPAIDLEKATNGPGQEPQDADLPTGPGIPAGDEVTWTYVVVNTGNVDLANVMVSDNLEGAICTIPLLAIGESQTCLGTGTAELGQYANVGAVSGEPVDEDGNPIPGANNQPLPPVTDSDPSHYFGNGPASIDIEKDTNGEDADMPTGPQIDLNGQVVWTYVVRNTGEYALANVSVTDNIEGVAPQYVSGDDNSDDILQVNEVWTYRATGVATLGQYANVGATSGDPVDENGNPALDLGGNPVPSPQDSDPSHYLGLADASIDLQKTVYKGHDNGASCPGGELVKDKSGTDITYCFVVTNTGATYLTDIELTDLDLDISLVNMTLLFGNPESLAPGNLLIYYYETALDRALVNTARTVGTPSDEEGNPITGLDKVTDQDVAEVQVLAAIGDYVWLDTNANGIQDPSEVGLPGIQVALYAQGGQQVDTTITDNSGLYLFDGLEAGTYSVGFTLPSSDHYFSPMNEASDDTVDSDADPTTGRTTQTDLSGGETDLSWDAGIFAPPKLVIEKEADLDVAQPNQSIKYSFTYRNDGLSDAAGVVITEKVPDHVNVDLVKSADGWACTPRQADVNSVCTFDLGTLKAKSVGTVDLTFVVVTDARLPESVKLINNVVLIDHDGTNGADPTGAGVDEAQVGVAFPQALDMINEPSQQSPRIFIPMISVR